MAPTTSSRPDVDRELLREAILRALDVVIDPELDEPITDLGFVHTVDVSPDGDLEVHLRLPTSFCAPNFAYLMVSDATWSTSATSKASRSSGRIVGPLCTWMFLIPSSRQASKYRYAHGSSRRQPRESPCHSAV